MWSKCNLPNDSLINAYILPVEPPIEIKFMILICIEYKIIFPTSNIF